MKSHPYVMSCWKLVSTSRGEINFLQGCSPWQVAHALVNGLTPINMLAALKGLSGSGKECNELRRRNGGEYKKSWKRRNRGWL